MFEQNVEIVRRVLSEWERGNFWTADYFDPSAHVRWMNPILAPAGGETRGIEELTRGMVEFLREWEGLTATAERIVDLGERVVTVELWRGRGKSSGVLTERRQGAIWTLRDAKITELIAYSDPAEALKAAGLRE